METKQQWVKFNKELIPVCNIRGISQVEDDLYVDKTTGTCESIGLSSEDYVTRVIHAVEQEILIGVTIIDVDRIIDMVR